MAFSDTLKAMMKRDNLSHKDISKRMGVSLAQVYRYVGGVSEPKWRDVLLLLEGMGYKLKMIRKVKKE